MTFTLQHFTSRLIHIPFYSSIIVSAPPLPSSFSLSCRSPTPVQQSMCKCQQKKTAAQQYRLQTPLLFPFTSRSIFRGRIWLGWSPRHKSHVLNCDKRKAATVSSGNVPAASEWRHDGWKWRLISNKLEPTSSGGCVSHQQLHSCRRCQRWKPAAALWSSGGISDCLFSELELWK